MARETDLYRRAGIEDEAEFYRTKFVSDEVLDARYFNPLNRFDMRFARTMWVYDNVRAGARLLDLGCGAGMLALLKRKGVTLAGVDLSDACAAAARRNGYDLTCAARLDALPFADAIFDYVVSLDVLGHVRFEEKDGVLSEIRRVLRPGGVTMHGIECTDRLLQKDYAEMSAEELRRFVEVDGHVGLEEEDEHTARFKRFFQHTMSQPRYALCLSSEEFIKQADRYGLPFEADFLNYLRGLSFKERRAFDMAMGYVFGKISDLQIKLPRSGLYLFLKASGAPLGPFYNEHRDRRDLLQAGVEGGLARPFCLDRDPRAVFDGGWYDAGVIPPVARWMGKRAGVRFPAASVSEVRLDLTTHMPGLDERPLVVEFFLNGSLLGSSSIFRPEWTELKLAVPASVRRGNAPEGGMYELEIRAGRTWQPRPQDTSGRDDRELSVAACNIEIFP
ncbi:MAG TPA: methyltransferase domain-containing protein [Pyrinomonadaceae bacterium]|nr:methyltransferase domain-containing protein [Pyrinomonadaceae bacterium]